MSELAIPEHIQPVVDELVDGKFFRKAPDLTTEQWLNIEKYVEPFVEHAPNENARHIRRRNAYYLIINDALSHINTDRSVAKELL